VQIKVTVVEFGGEPQLVFTASTDIKVGDELLFGGQRTWKKRRWCHKEKVLAAHEEIRLSGESGMTQGSINLELSLLFCGANARVDQVSMDKSGLPGLGQRPPNPSECRYSRCRQW